jgi:CSLREA domain-containing protein/uncharacterized repeat protein (TIGR01451 family)
MPAVTLTNVTVANNTSGIGLSCCARGTLTIRNSIVANNLQGASSSPSNCNMFGDVSSQGFNLVFPKHSNVFDDDCGFAASTNDLIDLDPKLGPLLPNGAGVLTQALLPGSAAIDAGNPAAPGSGGAACPATDARGIARPADGDLVGSARCDIGAFESVPFVVTSFIDDDDANPGDAVCAASSGRCTLRAAVLEANAIGGGLIGLPAGSYTLTRSGADNTAARGDLDVFGRLSIVGTSPSTTVIQACNTALSPNCSGIDRLFDVLSGGSLTLSGVKIRKGSTGGAGGGIFNRGELVLTDVVLEDNRAGAASTGGALENTGPDATATLTDVTISDNQAGGGAGIHNVDGALFLTNVTLSGNTATGSGGGLSQSLGSQAIPSATLTNVTVAANRASGGGGGIAVSGGTVTLANSIVANNVDTNTHGSANCQTVSFGAFSSAGFNLVFPETGCAFASVNGDLLNQDPLLGSLADNGGPTPTLALLSGSAAIDGGNPATPLDGQGGHCAAADQRGRARVDGNLDGNARCDIGAFEVVPVIADLSVTVTDRVATPALGASLTYTVTVSNAGPAQAVNAPVAAAFPSPLNNVSWSCSPGAGASCAPTSGTGDIAGVVTMPSGASVTYQVTATVAGTAANGATIGATATIAAPVGIDDPAIGNNRASDVDTVTFTECAPRPSVPHAVVPAGVGRVKVTLEVVKNSDQFSNTLQKVQVGTLRNAVVDVPAQTGVPTAQTGLGSGAVITPSVPVSVLVVFVRRVGGPGTAFTAPMTITDACGTWPTFAGGGTNVP